MTPRPWGSGEGPELCDDVMQALVLKNMHMGRRDQNISDVITGQPFVTISYAKAQALSSLTLKIPRVHVTSLMDYLRVTTF